MAHIPECEEKKRLEGLVDVFQRYRKALAKAVARIVKPGDIEDIVQETYLRLYQAAKRQPIRHPKSFMLKAARNLALSHVVRADAMNHLGTQGIQFESEEEADRFERQQVAFESPEAEAQAEEEFLIFCRAIRELPLQCRRAFLLRKVYGLSQDEVARELRISESTVEKHIAKGLIACSAYMAANGYARPSATAGARPNRRKVVAE
jgi:RNA polymerase sigma factor (sigma-70 family)